MFDKIKLKVFTDFETEHFIEGRPLEHFGVVNAPPVGEITITLIRILSFSLKAAVAGNNSIEFKGVIEILAFF